MPSRYVHSARATALSTVWAFRYNRYHQSNTMQTLVITKFPAAGTEGWANNSQTVTITTKEATVQRYSSIHNAKEYILQKTSEPWQLTLPYIFPITIRQGHGCDFPTSQQTGCGNLCLIKKNQRKQTSALTSSFYWSFGQRADPLHDSVLCCFNSKCFRVF